MKYTSVVIVLLFWSGLVQLLLGQNISVEIPDAFAVSETLVKIPVNFLEYTSGSAIYSYQATICFDSDVLEFAGTDVAETCTEQWQTVYNDTEPDAVRIAAFSATPSYLYEDTKLVNLVFNVVGDAGDQTDISFCPPDIIFFDTGMSQIEYNNGSLEVLAAGILGDVNSTSTANSTDALIVLSCDVAINTSSFCPINCGDVNHDNVVNSTDALIILSYDVGIPVPFAIETEGCFSDVNPCPGCTVGE